MLKKIKNNLMAKPGIKYNNSAVPTLISQDCLIEGNIKGAAMIRIDGQVKGNIYVEESLIIGEGAVIEGDIQSREVVIFGTINGNIKADSIEIKSFGKVTGKLNTQNLLVESGAIYNGMLAMDTVPNNNTKA